MTALTALAALQAPAARAADVDLYAKIGAPGLVLGVAHRYDSRFSARVDVSTIGSVKRNGVEQGVDYEGKVTAHRLGLFGDWFPTGGGFRLTGGLTVNDVNAKLVAQGAGKQLTVGNRTITTDASDRFDVSVKFPSVMPYLGIGWGHHQADGSGFLFDLGASLGRPKVTETHTGTNLSQIDQAEYDRELAELRDGVGKIPGLPQLSIGFAWRF